MSTYANSDPLLCVVCGASAFYRTARGDQGYCAKHKAEALKEVAKRSNWIASLHGVNHDERKYKINDQRERLGIEPLAPSQINRPRRDSRFNDRRLQPLPEKA